MWWNISYWQQNFCPIQIRISFDRCRHFRNSFSQNTISFHISWDENEWVNEMNKWIRGINIMYSMCMMFKMISMVLWIIIVILRLIKVCLITFLNKNFNEFRGIFLTTTQLTRYIHYSGIMKENGTLHENLCLVTFSSSVWVAMK